MKEKIYRQVYQGSSISFQVLDRDSAGVVSPDEPYIVISITDPQYKPAKLSSSSFCRGVLPLVFSDVDERFARLNISSSHLKAFTPEMAQEIASFVNLHVEQGIRLIVIHCEAGVSRSAGVASALSHVYNGEEAFFTSNFRPNPWVRQLVIAACQHRQSKRKENRG